MFLLTKEAVPIGKLGRRLERMFRGISAKEELWRTSEAFTSAPLRVVSEPPKQQTPLN